MILSRKKEMIYFLLVLLDTEEQYMFIFREHLYEQNIYGLYSSHFVIRKEVTFALVKK